MVIAVEKILMDLPGDPELAIVEIGKRLQSILEKVSKDHAHRDEYFYDAILIVKKWCETKGLPEPETPFSELEGNWSRILRYVRNIDRQNREKYIDQHVRKAAEGNYMKFGYAKLDPTEKEEIHKSLDNIRQIVEQSELPDTKKNALYEKLNDLAAEVDRAGTKTDAFFGLVGDLGIHLGRFGTNAKPLRKEITKILKVITRSRARAEDVALPGGEEFPLLQSAEDNLFDE